MLIEVFLVSIRFTTVRTDAGLLHNRIRILGAPHGMGIPGSNMGKSLFTEFTIILYSRVVC